MENDLDESLHKQRLLIFVEAILICACSMMNFQPSELELFGLTISASEFSKIIIVFPLLLTYQYTYYRLSRLRQRSLNLRHMAINSEIEILVGLNISEIYSRNAYTTRRGMQYAAHAEDRAGNILVAGMRALTWLPVALVYLVAFFRGTSLIARESGRGMFTLYVAALVFCLAILILSRVAGMFAYRLKTDTSNKTPT